MPAIGRASASPSSYPNFRSSTASVPPQPSGQPVHHSPEPFTPPADAPRRSLWDNLRMSFNPFGKSTFTPPVPANLAALRGLNKANPGPPGILKRSQPEAQFDEEKSPVETLFYEDEEEQTRGEDTYNKPLPSGIPYAGGHQTGQPQWI
ncbi:hypothetical protein P389DRAFT_75798 [Cystobasidium minutum MCA 4210]|uniref:uncharacterized protein n=1 Tax=Cystobasidium minutum MCA 4210 TaxID=1397322 RepID=UPI0034CFF7F3|eukprot:jgi/Rhomi1/75798/CE75797_35